MFNESKYTTWYFSIIEKSKDRILSGYTERHHIIPKCLGGTDNDINIVKLSAREHFVCHWLLTKMVTDKKEQYQLWNAFSCMLYRKNDSQRRYKISSKIFENIKLAGAKIKSIRFSGENNPMFGRTGKNSPHFGIKKSSAHIEKIRRGNIGKVRTTESKEKQSKSTKGRKHPAEWIEKTKQFGEANGMYGKKLSPESIAKRTATRKANKLMQELHRA
jgi:hypothetical protein